MTIQTIGLTKLYEPMPLTPIGGKNIPLSKIKDTGYNPTEAQTEFVRRLQEEQPTTSTQVIDILNDMLVNKDKGPHFTEMKEWTIALAHSQSQITEESSTLKSAVNIAIGQVFFLNMHMDNFRNKTFFPEDEDKWAPDLDK